MKGDVVDYARQKWPMYFSKFYEVTQMSGKSNRNTSATMDQVRLVSFHTMNLLQ